MALELAGRLLVVELGMRLLISPNCSLQNGCLTKDQGGRQSPSAYFTDLRSPETIQHHPPEEGCLQFLINALKQISFVLAISVPLIHCVDRE